MSETITAGKARGSDENIKDQYDLNRVENIFFDDLNEVTIHMINNKTPIINILIPFITILS
tara:strand:+ start:383 stop:565 length:183 start_codon:yes stop_codon:yes gene_type:complete